MKRVLCFVLLFIPLTVHAQFSKAIEDNSFFIEEAYNQEDRVVQHITNGSSFTGNSVEMSFTQEWPVWGRNHQLSYTVPYSFLSSPTSHGVGDVMVNYRYQAIDEPDRAFAPRISLILPTGNKTKGFGTGSAGVQMNLPYSHRLSNEFVLHANLGGTIVPDAAAVPSGTDMYTDLFAGGSAIYLVNSHFNVMLELLFSNSGSSAGRVDETIISPGVRYAIDIGDLQIVPGLAFPISFTGSTRSTSGVFLYLSFEHPY